MEKSDETNYNPENLNKEEAIFYLLEQMDKIIENLKSSKISH